MPLIFRTGNRVGFSRHAALAVTRRAYPQAARSRTRQGLSLITGSSLIGVGVSLFLNAKLGVPPFDVLISSLTKLTGASHGQMAWLASGVLFAAAAVLGRRPAFWAFVYVFLNGLAVDIASGLVNAPDQLALRAAFVLAGTVSIAAGIALVVHAGTTGGSFELLMRAGEDRGFSPARVRLGLEVGVIGLGVVLGGSLGPATVFFALTIAPMLRVLGQALSDHSDGRSQRMIEDVPAPASSLHQGRLVAQVGS